MGDERLTFSVSGLTIRGFHWHSDEWVPEPGQRLPCSLTGPIDILKDGKSVGHVCKEAPNKFKDWLKKAAEMDAVVENYPKSHRGKKGIEVPAIFVFTGEKNKLMINIMRAIRTDILKKKLRKKSLNFVDGDITKNMVFPSKFGDENHLDFSIEGMTVRGFDTYMEYWVPEIGNRFRCSISETGCVQLLNEGQTIGNVQHEGQKLFKMFVNADGVITAVVNGDPKKHRTKGEEVPVTFVFTGKWTKSLQNIKNQISEDITKKSKKKKSLKFIPGDITEKKKDLDNQLDVVAGTSGESGTKTTVLQEQKDLDNQLNVVAGTSGESGTKTTVLKEQKDTPKQQQWKEKKQGSGEMKWKAKASTSSETMTSTAVASDGSGEGVFETKAPSDQLKNTRKRRSDESEETLRKKASFGEQMPETEANTTTAGNQMHRSGLLLSDDKIVLTERNLCRISQLIGRNWTLLGIELGLKNVDTQRFEYNNPRDMATQVLNMLVAWKKRNADDATLYNLQTAMEHCPRVYFEQPELNDFFTEIRKERQKTTK